MVFDFLGTGLSVATFFGIYALLALSLNFEYGITGLPNFGLVLFYGVGAYSAGVLSSTVISWFANQNITNYCDITTEGVRMTIASTNPGEAVGVFVLGIAISAIVAGFFGLILSYNAIRIQEEWFLALVLLVAAEIVRIIATNYQGVGGVCGFNGLGGVPGPFQWISNVALQSAAFAGVVILLVACAFFYFQRQLNSPFGRLLKSIRDDDVASRTLGKNVIRTKVEVMIIGSAFAGIAGALFTYYSNYVNPDNFIPVVTFNVWVMIVLGGIGNNKGALLGAFIVTILQKALEIMSITVPIANASIVLNYLTYVIEGVVFILLLIYRPQGLLKEEPVKTPASEVIKKGEGKSSSAID